METEFSLYFPSSQKLLIAVIVAIFSVVYLCHTGKGVELSKCPQDSKVIPEENLYFDWLLHLQSVMVPYFHIGR